jgi:hypothetical protein
MRATRVLVSRTDSLATSQHLGVARLRVQSRAQSVAAEGPFAAITWWYRRALCIEIDSRARAPKTMSSPSRHGWGCKVFMMASRTSSQATPIRHG